MEKSGGSVKKIDENGNEVETFLFTHSQEEVEENKINKANAQAVFSPEFIPYYPEIAKEFELNATETVVYGFIRFYMSTGKMKRFYFTSQQLAEIVNTTAGRIDNILSKLKRLELIKTSRKVRSGGGTIRFVEVFRPHPGVRSNLTPALGLTSPRGEIHIKENKLKENKINTNTNVLAENSTAYGNEDVNWLLKEFENQMQFPSSGKKSKDRQMAWHLLKNFTREQLTYMLRFCATNQYAPRVGSIEKLWFKRGDVVAGIKSLQNKSNQRNIVKI